MAVYKGIEFTDQVAPFVRHMHSLNDHRETLAVLGGTWDTLSLLGHLSSLKTDMSDVRQGFMDLTDELLACLAEETYARVATALGYQAQIALDVLTRNLFERTADIGFLATDGPIVDACLADADQRADILGFLTRRFADYVAKYTVYQDIILLQPDGQVICRLKPGFDARSESAIVRRALDTSAAYVESYEATDFCHGDKALIYAYRVQSQQRNVGVLVLHFDMRAEVRAILSRLCENEELIAFLDGQRRVVLSSDRVLLPAGYELPLKPGANTLRLAGVQYIVAHRSPTAYQGYQGPGWTAVALKVADAAFQEEAELTTARVGFSGEGIFSSRLKAIPERARTIQLRLDRLVWNGQVQQVEDSNSFSRSLLDEIANTGRKTKDVFERSSGELLTLVASSLRDEVSFLSSLAVDILDRNLYERANDCRWWAVSPALKTLDASTCQSTLKYINGLYTVYSNILVFDANGVVLANSNPPALAGQRLQADWVRQCLALRDTEQYCVSQFAASSLYADEGTYIYCASISDDRRVLGGVALVFDSKPQFKAMLDAVLPKAAGSMAVFCRPDGQLISQTAELPIALPEQALQLQPGQKWSGVITEQGHCYTVGATCGNGYREFKRSDRYQEPVICVLVVPCGQELAEPIQLQGRMKSGSDGTEVATFYIGRQLLGIAARDIIECVELPNAVRIPQRQQSNLVGYSTWRTKSLPLLDMSRNFGTEITREQQRHALVFRYQRGAYGLLISALGPVVNMPLYDTSLGSESQLCSQIGKSGTVLVPILSITALLGKSSDLLLDDPAALLPESAS